MKSYRMSLAQTTLLEQDQNVLVDTIRELASEISGVNVESILTGSDIVWLKQLGIKWMKIGLRMESASPFLKGELLS